MGCGLAGRGPNAPLYTNEFSPPVHNLLEISGEYPENFPPSGVIKNDFGLFFDDREFIKQCQIVHIQEVTIHLERYISGIEIIYYLDGHMREVKHCTNKPSKKHSLPLSNTDSIVFWEITYTGKVIYSVTLETLEGRLLNVECKEGRGAIKNEVNLRQQRRGVVGVKGKIGEYLEGLSVHSWRMCGKNK